ncbi:MAG TPA: DUF1634 domain-containing protein [Coleofasciculaceae cyanobacterium]
MARLKQPFSEHQFEQLLGNLLRAGVVLSAGMIAVGGVLYLIRHGTEPPSYHIFRGEPAEFRVLPDIVKGAVTMERRRSLIQLGLLVLIATPILRVAFSAYGFLRQGDRTYMIITLIVLGLLLYSLFQV